MLQYYFHVKIWNLFIIITKNINKNLANLAELFILFIQNLNTVL